MLRRIVPVVSSLILFAALFSLVESAAYARPNCDGDDPPPICGGGKPEPEILPTPQPATNYPAVVRYLLSNSTLVKQVINTIWNEGGRAVAKQQIENSINGHSFADGVGGHDANASLSAITVNQIAAGSGPNQVSMELVIPGNDTTLETTTPTIFGSYGDPEFRVGFDLIVLFTMSVEQSNNPIRIDNLSVQVINANIHGSNAVGTLVETLADFFTGGDFSRNITSRINQDISVKDRLAWYIRSALDHI